MKLSRFYNYRIMSALKVETDIITSIAASLVGGAVILVKMHKMYVKTIKSDVIGSFYL